jgi:aquaporin Z
VFLVVILGATDKRGIGSHAGLAIGPCLTLIHLISIPVTNTRESASFQSRRNGPRGVG